jgi:hypothetical protein
MIREIKYVKSREGKAALPEEIKTFKIIVLFSVETRPSNSLFWKKL